MYIYHIPFYFIHFWTNIKPKTLKKDKYFYLILDIFNTMNPQTRSFDFIQKNWYDTAIWHLWSSLNDSSYIPFPIFHFIHRKIKKEYFLSCDCWLMSKPWNCITFITANIQLKGILFLGNVILYILLVMTHMTLASWRSILPSFSSINSTFETNIDRQTVKN